MDNIAQNASYACPGCSRTVYFKGKGENMKAIHEPLTAVPCEWFSSKTAAQVAEWIVKETAPVPVLSHEDEDSGDIPASMKRALGLVVVLLAIGGLAWVGFLLTASVHFVLKYW